MDIKSQPSKITGHINLPGSKSHTIRAFLLAALAQGTSVIEGPLISDDTNSVLRAIEQFGAKFKRDENKNVIEITGTESAANLLSGINSSKISDDSPVPVDVGNSGSLMYFLAPVLAAGSRKVTFTGDSSICKRPVDFMLKSLEQLGVKTDGAKNPPFTVQGPADFSKGVTAKGDFSQPVSGLMMSAAFAQKELNITLTAPEETPYLTMTKHWLETAGARCHISPDFKSIKVSPSSLPLQNFTCRIPSDWESAAFPLVASYITKSSVVIDNLDTSGSQGDSIIAEYLANWPLQINVSSIPDSICALTVAAIFTKAKTEFTGISICRKKETDRIKALCTELSKLGAKLEDTGNTLTVYGNPDELHGGTLESYKDHRLAMAFACAGLGLKSGESVIIKDAECCSVSFPNFFETMKQIGANFTEL